jgi:2-polyprenyl-3-methyl-5-hydroxy-6-metoxy-1,4-benzoquinol methylase
LKALIESNFRNTHKNVENFSEIFNLLTREKNCKLVDYGSSWGYMSFQFKKIGFDVQSFEISKPRAHYGNTNLGLNIQTSVSRLTSGNDIFFSSHVIEHVPSISEMIDVGKSLLSSQGFFIAECPNGSEAFRKKKPFAFNQAWGLVHPSYLSEKFYQHVFRDNPYLILSSPYDLNQVRKWDQKSQVIGDTQGDQLLVIARVNMKQGK